MFCVDSCLFESHSLNADIFIGSRAYILKDQKNGTFHNWAMYVIVPSTCIRGGSRPLGAGGAHQH